MNNLDFSQHVQEEIPSPKQQKPLRPVQFEIVIYDKQFSPDGKELPFSKRRTESVTGVFHQFALEGDGQDIGPVAIVETPDGQIHTPAAHKIKFLDK